MASRKKLFVTMLSDEQTLGKSIAQSASRYGIETCGVVWREEPGKPVWGEVAAMILKENCDGWLLTGTAEEWSANADTRSHISLAAVKAANLMGGKFTFFSMIQPVPEKLPTPLASAIEVTADKLGVRLAAKLGLGKALSPEYFLDVHPLPAGDGFVVELGPRDGEEWSGALLATTGGGEISHHTVGARGVVPERGVVEYAMKGIKLESGGREYSGWSVANRLDSGASYFVRVSGESEGLVFGPLPSDDSADLYSLALS